MPKTLPAPPIDQILAADGPLAGILPGYEFRTEQAEMCEAILAALESQNHCLVEAGTGVGKTVAYLIPAAIAASRGKKTVISTHTINLQTQLIEKDIPRVIELFGELMPKLELKAVLMKGRGNYLCLQDLDAAEADILKISDPMFRKLKPWSRKTKTGDMADLPFVYPEWYDVAANIDSCRHQECRYYEKCFYYRMRWSAAEANLFVVNHALFLSDLALRKSDPNSAILPDYHYVVFDEAHHLEEVATKIFGIEANNRTIPRFIDKLKRTKGLDLETTTLDSIELHNAEAFSQFEKGRHEFFFRDVLTSETEFTAKSAVEQMCVGLESVHKDLLKQVKESEPPLKDRIEGLSRMGVRLREEIHTLFYHQDDDYIRWGAHSDPDDNERHGRRARNAPRITLHYTPVDVGKRMEEMLWGNVESAILTSATLANSGGFSYLRARLNVPRDADECIVGSPFNFKHQALLYVPSHMPAPAKTLDEEFVDEAVKEITRLLTLSEGRAFLLFTSRRMLNEMYERLICSLPYPLFRQGDQPPGLLLKSFRESGNGCLLGTQTFWEGVDVRGEALSCVIIDRLPFAVPDSPITRARTDAIKESGGDWFNDYSIPQAQIRLKQGFGRLIRTKEDKGIVCILDNRILTKSYGAEFVKFLPPASRASIWSRVEKFWHKGKAVD